MGPLLPKDELIVIDEAIPMQLAVVRQADNPCAYLRSHLPVVFRKQLLNVPEILGPSREQLQQDEIALEDDRNVFTMHPIPRCTRDGISLPFVAPNNNVDVTITSLL